MPWAQIRSYSKSIDFSLLYRWLHSYLGCGVFSFILLHSYARILLPDRRLFIAFATMLAHVVLAHTIITPHKSQNKAYWKIDNISADKRRWSYRFNIYLPQYFTHISAQNRDSGARILRLREHAMAKRARRYSLNIRPIPDNLLRELAAARPTNAHQVSCRIASSYVSLAEYCHHSISMSNISMASELSVSVNGASCSINKSCHHRWHASTQCS